MERSILYSKPPSKSRIAAESSNIGRWKKNSATLTNAHAHKNESNPARTNPIDLLTIAITPPWHKELTRYMPREINSLPTKSKITKAIMIPMRRTVGNVSFKITLSRSVSDESASIELKSTLNAAPAIFSKVGTSLDRLL